MVLGLLFKKGKKKVKKLKRAKKPKKKITAKRKIKKTTSIKKKVVTQKKEKNIKKIGKVTHYFPKVKAAVIKITKGPLRIGEVVYIKGHTSDFEQKVASMQIEHVPIKVAKKGDIIGLKVKLRVREGDVVFKEF